jgi:hypothetical protein
VEKGVNDATAISIGRNSMKKVIITGGLALMLGSTVR